MEFKVTRTSDIWGNRPDCEDAFQKAVVVDEGTEDERIEMQWFVTINTVEELIKFINKYTTNVVINTSEQVPVIEIYDYWRE